MHQPERPRIAVIGAGPVGLEAALAARVLGFAVTVYERGRVAEFVQRWGHVRLFTPFGMNATPLGRAALRLENPKHELPADADIVTGRDYVTAYLEPLAMTGALIELLKLETQVIQIGRSGALKSDSERRADRPFRLLVREAKGTERIEEADIILDCAGTYGSPRWLGDGGIPAIGELAARAQIAYGLDDVLGADRGKYAGKTVLVVGAGHSAATQVVRLAELAGKHSDMWIVWLARQSRSQPLLRSANDPLRERDRLAAKANMLATRGEGHVEFHASAGVDEVVALGPDRGFRVVARVAGKAKSWDVDRIVACVGYQPDPMLTRELQLKESPAMQGLEDPMNLKTAEADYFVLGAKSIGRDGQFLMQRGFEQVRATFALITKRADPFGGASPEKLLYGIPR
jgi:thioredoxin reductase